MDKYWGNQLCYPPFEQLGPGSVHRLVLLTAKRKESGLGFAWASLRVQTHRFKLFALACYASELFCVAGIAYYPVYGRDVHAPFLSSVDRAPIRCLFDRVVTSNPVGDSRQIGTLRKDDHDGSENVGKKNEFEFFLSRLFEPAQYVKCRRLFLELNS